MNTKLELALVLSFFLAVGFSLVACEETNTDRYTLMESSVLPDSNKQKYADFIQATVSAASSHMSGGDYEDPEDLVREATRTAYQLYSVPAWELGICNPSCNRYRIGHTMTEDLVRLEDSLIAVHNAGKK